MWVNNPFFLHWNLAFSQLIWKKKSRGGWDTPRMMRMKTLFRPLLDHHDRGISQSDSQRDPNWVNHLGFISVSHFWTLTHEVGFHLHIPPTDLTRMSIQTVLTRRSIHTEIIRFPTLALTCPVIVTWSPPLYRGFRMLPILTLSCEENTEWWKWRSPLVCSASWTSEG